MNCFRKLKWSDIQTTLVWHQNTLGILLIVHDKIRRVWSKVRNVYYCIRLAWLKKCSPLYKTWTPASLGCNMNDYWDKTQVSRMPRRHISCSCTARNSKTFIWSHSRRRYVSFLWVFKLPSNFSGQFRKRTLYVSKFKYSK